MKRIYIAAVAEEDNKYYAFVIPIQTGNNIKSILERYKDTIIWHLCESRKQADECVTLWNKNYKANGIYMFDSPKF